MRKAFEIFTQSVQNFLFPISMKFDRFGEQNDFDVFYFSSYVQVAIITCYNIRKYIFSSSH